VLARSLAGEVRGSVAFGDSDTRVGFGYVTNLWSFRIDEQRASNLAEAVKSCLG
jgi:hypothetical protein